MLISNNCCAADLYSSNKVQFNHPFMWCILLYNDIINLIDNWNTIDYRNICLTANSHIAHTFNIVIDDKVTAQYVHYFKNSEYKTPTKFPDRFNEMRHIGYDKMEEYVIDRYLSRLSRMTNTPIFLIHINKNTWQCDITEYNIGNIVDHCVRNKFHIMVFGKANIPSSPYLFHVNLDFTYPYEVKDFINQNLPNIKMLL